MQTWCFLRVGIFCNSAAFLCGFSWFLVVIAVRLWVYSEVGSGELADMIVLHVDG